MCNPSSFWLGKDRLPRSCELTPEAVQAAEAALHAEMESAVASAKRLAEESKQEELAAVRLRSAEEKTAAEAEVRPHAGWLTHEPAHS